MTAVIVLDFDQPWEMMESLTKWTSLLTDVVQGFMKDLPLEQRDMLKTRLARHFKNFDLEGNENVAEDSKKQGKTDKKDAEDKDSDSDDSAAENFMDYLQDQIPLPEGVLKSNLGIPIIVACHKADLIGRGDRAQFLEQNIDFIQKNIRQHCLYYGASLIFTEIHQTSNLEVLYKYILHRLYDQEFKEKPSPNQKNSIFIPTGYDSQQFIDTLCKNTGIDGKIFEEVIKRPPPP